MSLNFAQLSLFANISKFRHWQNQYFIIIILKVSPETMYAWIIFTWMSLECPSRHSHTSWFRHQRSPPISQGSSSGSAPAMRGTWTTGRTAKQTADWFPCIPPTWDYYRWRSIDISTQKERQRGEKSSLLRVAGFDNIDFIFHFLIQIYFFNYSLISPWQLKLLFFKSSLYLRSILFISRK